MSQGTLNSLSDWVGIPLLVVLIACLVLSDLREMQHIRRSKNLLLLIVILSLAALALNIVRFVMLA